MSAWFAALVLIGCATAFAADGDLDTSFGDGGLALSGITDSGGFTGGIAVQPDGKIVLCAGSHATSGSSGPDFFIARFTPDGMLDPAFSYDGRVTIDFQQSTDFCWAVALQPDGRIIVAGAGRKAGGGDYDFAIARLNADGTLDTGFGAGTGKVMVAFDQGSGNYDVAAAVAVQPDGRIVVAGYAKGTTVGNGDMAVVRLLPDGTRDTSFNLSGRKLVGFEPNANFESEESVQALAIDPQGRIVLAGNVYAPDLGIYNDFAVARLLPDGQLDPDFDADGRVTLAFDIVTGGTDRLQRMILDHAARIVLVGCTDAGIPGHANFDMAIARLLPDGSPDSAFGIGGRSIVPFDLVPGGPDEAYSVAEQANGKLLLAGSAYGTDFDGAIARINPDGTLDAQFGNQGHETFDFLTPGGTQVLTNVALQGTAIVAAGQLTLADGTHVDNFVARIDSGLISANGFE